VVLVLGHAFSNSSIGPLPFNLVGVVLDPKHTSDQSIAIRKYQLSYMKQVNVLKDFNLEVIVSSYHFASFPGSGLVLGT
jgi:hypothetical protein